LLTCDETGTKLYFDQADRREEAPDGEGSTADRGEHEGKSLELFANLVKLFWDDVSDRITGLVRQLVEKFLDARRTEALGAGAYDPTDGRGGYRGAPLIESQQSRGRYPPSFIPVGCIYAWPYSRLVTEIPAQGQGTAGRRGEEVPALERGRRGDTDGRRYRGSSS
jgi:hypothetical protein